MKRWMLVMLLAISGMQMAGCHRDRDDDDDDLELKVDTKGDKKSIEIDND